MTAKQGRKRDLLKTESNPIHTCTINLPQSNSKHYMHINPANTPTYNIQLEIGTLGLLKQNHTFQFIQTPLIKFSEHKPNPKSYKTIPKTCRNHHLIVCQLL